MSYRAQRLAALALLVLFFPSVAMATAYALRPARTPLVVYGLDTHHRVLPTGSELRPGQRITVVATGFFARTRVQIVDTSRRQVAFVHADSEGVARTSLVVPGRTAQHLSVALDGSPAVAAPASAAPSTAASSARRDGQTVSVTVPLLRRYTYTIVGGNGVQGSGIGIDPGQHTGDGTGGGLANTGVDILALLSGGVLLVILGFVVRRGGRRRSSPDGRL